MRGVLVLTAGLLFLHTCYSQDSVVRTGTLTPEPDNPCIEVEDTNNCGSCLAAGPQCAFCTSVDKEYEQRNVPRCDLEKNHISNKCTGSDLVRPKTELKEIDKEAVKDGTATKNAVQISPQKLELKLRPNDPKTFPLTFRLAENYPVDLYYLMDLSYSMKDDKNKLATLGTKIAKEMKTITENFQLGFGSFVDKVVMPYVSTAPSKLVSPCSGCDPPYGFKNQLKLDQDISLFSTNVMAAKVSGNLDAPEGGFDAIMQSIVCDEKIGWRNQSRRMLLFSTDASFHFAGDGKLGGIVKPNDGMCHLDADGQYTESKTQDYPSVSQIAAKIKEKNVNIIFAVTNDQFPTYKQLEAFIPGSETGELANDSSNIVTLVRQNYEKITSKLELTTIDADGVEVKFFTACKGNQVIETNVCKQLNIGDTVTVNVTVEATSCPTDISKAKKKIKIKPVGLTDTLEIDLEILCQCDCEKPEFSVPNQNSPKCQGQGTFVCGTCTCNEGFYGDTCNCSSGNITSAEKQKQCIGPGSTIPCTGKGECVCGKCECFTRGPNSAQKYSGEFCECNDYACPYFDGAVCGGYDRGDCKCEKCHCKPGWSGDDCSCSTRNDSCIKDGVMCSGFGDCVCNECRCFNNSDRRGKYCEDCKNCKEVCRKNRYCVQCAIHKSGPKTEEECQEECIEPDFIESVEELPGDMPNCEFKDDDDCLFFFSYYYVGNDLKIKAQKKRECPPQVNVLAIVLGVIGGIVAVGLAILFVWKLVTTISDKRELARFEKETQNAKWDTGENPIYKQATSTFQNPTYAGR